MPLWLWLGFGLWRRDLPPWTVRALDAAHILGMLATVQWLVWFDTHGLDGGDPRRLLLLPADILLAACWPLYWLGYWILG